MNDLFLGIIAAAVLVMAIIQVAAVVIAARAARRVGDVVTRLEQDVRPLVANLQSISAEAKPIVANLQTLVAEARPIMANIQAMATDAARATSAAASQVERAERVVADFVKRVDGSISAFQSSILKPARQGFAVFQGIRTALGVFRDREPRGPAAGKRAPIVDEEDALFIG